MSQTLSAGHVLNEVSEQPDDARLLEAFAVTRSHEAFAELVRRHAGWVYASALRQVRDPHAADDVTQTVFTLLAAKADSLPNRPLGGWLFSATRYASANERRSAARRRKHERAASRSETYVSLPTGDQSEMAPLLDEALAHLRRGDREAVLLRYFRGRGAPEIAAELGVSEAAARKRLTRAVGRLRRFFAARGVTVSAAGIGALLAVPHSAPGMSPERITAEALAPAPHQLAAAGAVAKAFWWTNVGRVAAVVMIGAAVTVGGTLAASAVARSHASGAPLASTLKQPRPRLLLTCLWDNSNITLPPPPSFPEELRETSEYRDWARAGDARTLRWRPTDGREYVVDVATVPDDSGRSAPIAPRLRLYRADGTLQTEVTTTDLGRRRQWCVFAEDGKTRRVEARGNSAGSPPVPYVESVRFFDPDGTSREFLSRLNGTVYGEWLLDREGRRVRLVHGTGK